MKDSLLFSLDGREDIAKSIIKAANEWAANKTEIGYLNKQNLS